MYRSRLLIGVAALFCAAVITGCVDTADNTLSEMEQDWARVIGESYPGHRIPKTMPPAVRGSVVIEESVKPADTASVPAAPVPDNDPAAMVDKAAADTPESIPEPKEQPAPAPAEKKEAELVAPAVPTPAVKEEKAAPAPDAREAAAPEADAKKGEKAAEAKAASAVGKNAEAVVKAGDTLTGLAKEFYGDAKYYDVILKANPQIKNPKRLKIGMKLVIPAL